VLVGGIDFIAMTMALRNFSCAAIDRRDSAAAPELGLIGAKPHRSTKIAVLRSPLQLVAAQPFGHQTDNRLRRRSELRGIGVRDTDQITHSLDDRHLHAETDAEIG